MGLGVHHFSLPELDCFGHPFRRRFRCLFSHYCGTSTASAVHHTRHTRKRIKGAHPPLHHGGRPGPVHTGFGLFNFVCIGHTLARLHLRLKPPHLREGLHDHAATQVGQLVVQHSGGVCGLNRQALAQQHVAGIQPRVHLHDSHAGDGIARFNRAVNRCRAAPARQQGGVDVQAAVAGCIQHPLRQDQTVSGDDHHIGLGLRDGGLRGLCVVREFTVQPQAARLRHRDVVRQSELLDRRGLQLHAATCRTVGLGQNQHHLVPGRVQLRQRHAGKFGGARKNHTHGLGLFSLLHRHARL